MSDKTQRDPLLEHAREEAEGTEILEAPEQGASLEQEREEAQGVEVFEDPDATLPGDVLREGSPGQEALTGNSVGLGREDEPYRDEESDESW